MSRLRPEPDHSEPVWAKDSVVALAGRQWGRVAGYQLTHFGVERPLIRSWRRSGWLIHRLPGVYAVGHAASSVEAVLTEALLYAGPGAMLTGAVGAWWLHLRDHEPDIIEVATPRKRRSLPGVHVRGRRTHTRIWHHGLPTAPVADVLLDYATSATQKELRRALAQVEYHGYLELDTLVPRLRPGCRGAKALRAAIAAHDPRLARTKSPLEIDFVAFCAEHGLPAPEINVRVAGVEVDALWRAERVVVELDGGDNHHTPAQMRRDHAKDLTLRRARHAVLRYATDQLRRDATAVADDIEAALGRGPVSI